MQKNALVACAAFLALCACSCKDKKNTDPTPDPVVYDNYTQLKTGNYWVYQVYDVDSIGNGPATNVYDSTYISKDTSINGNTYYQMVSRYPGYAENWVRDSLHYMVDVYGNIRFSSEDFTTNFLSMAYIFMPDVQTDTTAWVTKKMADRDVPYTTPAGTFITSDFQTIFEMYPNYQAAGARRVLHKRYAKNTGLVSETIPFYMDMPGYHEKRLVRYHLN